MKGNQLTLRITFVLLLVIGGIGALFWVTTRLGSRQLSHNTKNIEQAYRQVFAAYLSSEAKLDEGFVQLRAHEVATNVVAYLKQKYGTLEKVPPSRELERDLAFQKVAIQWVTKDPPPDKDPTQAADLRIGYTVVYSRDFTMTTHTQKRLIGKNVKDLSEKKPELYLFWWDIFGRAVYDNSETKGAYLWPEADGEVLIKYMVCYPIEGTQLVVAATYYPRFKNEREIVASASAVATTLFDMDSAARRHARYMVVGSMIMLVISILAILFITRREALRVDLDKRRVENQWRLAHVDKFVESFIHGFKNDHKVIKERASALRRHISELPLDHQEAARKAVDNIYDRSNRILIQTRFISKHPEIKETLFNAVDLIKRLTAKDLNSEGGDRISITLIGLSAAWMRGKEKDISTAFENVIINAKQAMGITGTLCVSVTEQRTGAQIYLRFVFRDTGRGFERPEKATEYGWTTRGDRGGSGIGLSVVDRIVFQHHGYLYVRNSRRRGWGGEVEIWLPSVTKQGRSWSSILLIFAGPAKDNNSGFDANGGIEAEHKPGDSILKI